MIRVYGDIRRLNVDAMDHKAVHAMIYDIMNDGQRKFYEENKEADFSFEVPGLAYMCPMIQCRHLVFRLHQAGLGKRRRLAR